MKVVAIPKNKEIVNKLNADAFIFPIKKLSVNYEVYYTIDEAKDMIVSLQNKEIFISLNKNYTNNELDLLKQTLIELNDLKINGVIFYDLSILNLKEKLNLKYNLIWYSEHMTTNYNTCNYYGNFGVNKVILSNEITLKNILKIKEKTKMEVMFPVFGYIPMFTSFRHLIDNYLKTFNLKDDSSVNYIYKEDKVYPIIDNNEGTTVYSSFILNSIEEIEDLKQLDYIIINSFLIKDDDYIKIVDNYKKGIFLNIENSGKGFLYKETIYKVK